MKFLAENFALLSGSNQQHTVFSYKKFQRSNTFCGMPVAGRGTIISIVIPLTGFLFPRADLVKIANLFQSSPLKNFVGRRDFETKTLSIFW
jgi:hypothetical protein